MCCAFTPSGILSYIDRAGRIGAEFSNAPIANEKMRKSATDSRVNRNEIFKIYFHHLFKFSIRTELSAKIATALIGIWDIDAFNNEIFETIQLKYIHYAQEK